MIAITLTSSADITHDQFLALLPKIQRSARLAFRGLPFDERDELIAEVVANAYCAFANLVRQDREHLAYPTPLASYAIRQVRQGRRVGSRLNIRDVMSPAGHAHRRLAVEHLDHFDRETQ